MNQALVEMVGGALLGAAGVLLSVLEFFAFGSDIGVELVFTGMIVGGISLFLDGVSRMLVLATGHDADRPVMPAWFAPLAHRLQDAGIKGHALAWTAGIGIALCASGAAWLGVSGAQASRAAERARADEKARAEARARDADDEQRLEACVRAGQDVACALKMLRDRPDGPEAAAARKAVLAILERNGVCEQCPPVAVLRRLAGGASDAFPAGGPSPAGNAAPPALRQLQQRLASSGNTVDLAFGPYVDDRGRTVPDTPGSIDWRAAVQALLARRLALFGLRLRVVDGNAALRATGYTMVDRSHAEPTSYVTVRLAAPGWSATLKNLPIARFGKSLDEALNPLWNYFPGQ